MRIFIHHFSLIFLSTLIISCDSKIEKNVYFSVKSTYCSNCELVVNNKKHGKLKTADFDKITSEDQLKNSDLIFSPLSAGTHQIIVVNQQDTINHIKWTLKCDGNWKNQNIATNPGMAFFENKAKIKNISNAVIIELSNP